MVSEDVRGGYLVPEWVQEKLEKWYLELAISTRRELVMPASQVVSQEFA